MAAPTLTAAEIAQLKKDLAEQTSVRDAMLDAVPAKQAKSAELAVSDGSFKKFFTYYNDDIIGIYDDERKELNGEYIASPILEVDITNPASLIASRTSPAPPATDVIRIAEFDGGPLVVDADNEQQHIADQADVEDALQNGFAGTTPTLNASSVTDSNLTPSSISLDMTDSSSSMSFSVGDVFVIHDGGSDAAIVEVTGVNETTGGSPPPYSFTLDIELLMAPAGTISSGADVIDAFVGFTDSERNLKTSTDGDLQPVMDAFVSNLEGLINNRVSNLNAQLTALAAQQDPDATAEITTTQGLVNTSKSFLNAYLVSTDISDTGLGTLSSERSTRGSEITTRLAQIVANFTGQTENYFDRRYNSGNDRGNTSRGTLRLQKNSEKGEETVQNLADAAQDAIDAINAILA